MFFKTIRHNIGMQKTKINENVFPGAHFQEYLRLLSHISLQVNSNWTFSPMLLIDSQIKNPKI